MDQLKQPSVSKLLAIIVLILAILLIVLGRLDLIVGGLIAATALAVLLS